MRELLLVEDDPVDQMAFLRWGESQSGACHLTVADSLRDALILIRSHSFDLILSDYRLPDGTALEVLAAPCRAPVIVITGAGDEEVAVQSLKAGALDYLIKDGGGRYLLNLAEVVENAIAKRQAEELAQILSKAVLNTTRGILVTDGKGNLIFANEAFRRLHFPSALSCTSVRNEEGEEIAQVMVVLES